MTVLYKSTTSAPVNAGSYTVTQNPGLELPKAVDELDALVGISLTRTYSSADSIASEVKEILGAIPVIIPNSSTVATNGDITVTALADTYDGGAWVYLPANAIVGGLAGLYWTIFSSTTAGNVKTNYVNPATTEFIPYVPEGTPVSAVGSNSAYTTTTGSDLPLVNITLPANSVSPGSALKVYSRVTCPNAADNKIVKHKLGTTDMGSQTFTTSTGGALSTAAFARTSAQQVIGSFGDSGIAATTFGSVDTSAASKIQITGQLAAGTGYLVLEAFAVEKTIA